MNRRTYLRTLVKKLLNEESNLLLKKTGVSIDEQVDKYLGQYVKLSASDDKSPEKFDVEGFVDHVVELVDNHDNLLEFRNTIIKRALNVLNTIDKTLTVTAEDMFRDVHDIALDKTKGERMADETQPPAANRAGPGGV